MNFFTTDPGEDTGWAWFYESRLTYCGLIAWDGWTPARPNLDFEQARALGFTLVVEKPQVYRASRSKADPNDLIFLAMRAGVLINFYCLYTENILTPTPAEWKGQTPKSVSERRTRKLLTPEETRVLAGCGVSAALLHNVIDAVGIGLWALGR